MSIIKPLLYFLSISFTFSIFTKKKFSEVIVFSFLIPVFLIYFAGILGNTKYGFYLSLPLCFFWIIEIIKNIKNKNNIKNIINQYFDIGLVVFVVLFVGVSIYLRFASFFQWDEFTHWGPMVKEMHRLNKLYCVDESLLSVHKDYPPMVSILELLWCYLSNGYEERFIYRAIGIFSISLIIPFISLTKDNKRLQNILSMVFAVMIFISSFFIDFMASQGYGLLSNLLTSYPDALVGLFSSFTYIQIYKIDRLDIKESLLISILLSFLLMIKQISFAFYLVILLFSLLKINKLDLSFKSKMVNFVLCFVVVPLIAYYSWNVYSNLYTIDSQFAMNNISIPNLIDIIFFDKGLDYQITTKYNFINALLKRPMLRLFKLTYLQFSLLMLITIFLILKFLLRESKYNIYSILSPIIIGVFGFAFMMFVLYMFSYSEVEAVNLASFERYMETYLVFVMYIALFIFVKAIMTSDNYICVTLSSAFVLLVIIANVQNNKEFIVLKDDYDGITTQYEYIELTNQIDAFVNSNDKVLIISQTSDYFLEIVLKYLYLDYDFDYVAIGKTSDEYPYRLDLTFEEWQDYYSKYDYIYTYNTNEEFYHSYWVDLQNEYLLNNRFYTVDEDGYLKLVPWASLEE